MSRRILLVDDDPDILLVARTALEASHGWYVETASSGPEALAQAVRTAPDAVILDVSMPGMDGAAVLARLRGDPRTESVPVIFLTAKATAPEGAQGFIAKPFDPWLLARRIEGTLGWAP